MCMLRLAETAAVNGEPRRIWGSCSCLRAYGTERAGISSSGDCGMACFCHSNAQASVQTMLAVPGPLSRIYVLFVVAIGWVFFRAENLGQAITMIRSLFGIGVT